MNTRATTSPDYRTNRRSCAFFGSFYLNCIYTEGLIADAAVCAEIQCSDFLAPRVYKRAR